MKLQQREFRHGANMLRQLRDFWVQNHLCDIVIKSSDGREHHAHRNVLSAASKPLMVFLNGSFNEGTQIQLGQPINFGASGDVVHALLDYIYGGEPDISTADALELLRLAHAYDLMDLLAEIESELQRGLNSPLAFDVLQQINTLPVSLTDLRRACEKRIADDFSHVYNDPGFTELSASQVARLVSRVDLLTPREEAVVEALLRWMNRDIDTRRPQVGILLQHVDFASLSMENLSLLDRFSQQLAGDGYELKYLVDEAVQKRLDGASHKPKRKLCPYWSPELGGLPAHYTSGEWVAGDWNRPGQWRNPHDWVYDSEEEDLGHEAMNFCRHEGHFYIADGLRLVRWPPGATQGILVVNEDLPLGTVHVSPTGQIFFVDCMNHKLLTVCDGQVQFLLEKPGLTSVFVAADGTVYLVGNTWVARMDGDSTVPLLDSEDLARKLSMQDIMFKRLFVLGEHLYILALNLDWDAEDFIAKISPGSDPVVVGHSDGSSNDFRSLFVTENGCIYCADGGPFSQIVLFDPNNDQLKTGLRVVDNNDARFWRNDRPVDVLVHSGGFYALYESGLIFNFPFPRRLVLPDKETKTD